MKNIMVIDGAKNCTYSIFEVSEKNFRVIFPGEQDIEFAEDLIDRIGNEKAEKVLKPLWKKRIPRTNAMGIHGILFYELLFKKEYYPNKKESDLDTVGREA